MFFLYRFSNGIFLSVTLSSSCPGGSWREQEREGKIHRPSDLNCVREAHCSKRVASGWETEELACEGTEADKVTYSV